MILRLGIAMVVLLCATVARAQPAPVLTLPELGDTHALEAGGRAPWAGMLVRGDDLFALQTTIGALQIELQNARTLQLETVSGRTALLAAAEAGCVARVTLHDELWRDRRDELATKLEEERAESRAGPSWFEHPVTWTIIGAAIGGVIVGSIVSLVR